MGMKVGVLALQGAFREQAESLEALGADASLVKTPEQLDLQALHRVRAVGQSAYRRRQSTPRLSPRARGCCAAGPTVLARGGAAPLPVAIRAAGALLFAAIGVLVVTGTLATAAGPHPGSTAVRRIGSFQPSVDLHVKATAAFGIVFLLLAAWAWRERVQEPWLIRGCAGLVVLLGVQMAIGEAQYRNGLPWWLVLIHVTVAACVFAWTVGLVARLWRPVARNAD